MKALVTGAAGFVGRWLVGALREAGWRVATADLHPPADLVGDLGRIPLPRTSFDAVFHLAGFANPAASVHARLETFESNAAVTARLARRLRAGRFVFASSGQVYRSSERPANEASPVAPRTPYAASKLCGEALALAATPRAVVLRLFNHTGPGQSDAYLCPRIARQIALAEAGRRPRRVDVAELAPRLDLFDVRDMVRAYRLAAERAPAGAIYNVSTGRPVRVGEILKLFLSMARVPLELRARQGTATVLSGDASRFRAATGWLPELPLPRTLSDILEYERSRARSPKSNVPGPLPGRL
jgi:GDP-4-dehydro-6-deoxy-D-mannose reductase